MLFKIMDLRAYERAKRAYDEGLKETDMSKRPSGGLIETVRAMEFEIAKERIRKHREEQGEG